MSQAISYWCRALDNVDFNRFSEKGQMWGQDTKASYVSSALVRAGFHPARATGAKPGAGLASDNPVAERRG